MSEHITEVMEADIGEFLTDIPVAVMAVLDMTEGDELQWTVHEDGTITIAKA